MKHQIIRAIGMLTCVAAVSTAAAGEDCTSRLSKLQDNQPAHATDVTDYVFNCPNFIGNVGIGTVAPNARLQVATPGGGNLYISDYGCGSFGGIGGSPALTGCANYALLSGGADTFINRPSGSTIRFREANREQMIIASGGYVGIGTISPSFPLDVNGTIAMGGVALSTSDQRLKTDITAIASGALTRIMALNPVTFRWKNPKDYGMRGIQIGLIAQDVEKILPTAVFTAQNAVKTKSIKYNELTAVLIKAVQEQQMQISMQQKQIATQQKQIVTLRKQIMEIRTVSTGFRSSPADKPVRQVAQLQ